ncbi:MAG: GtrA family protein, partial [Burkholderiales bacterium]
ANTALGYAVIFGCMYGLGWGALASNVAGYAVGLVVSFTLNRRFTFRSEGKARAELLRFICIFAVAWSANFAVLIVLLNVVHVHEVLAQILAGIVYFVLSFVLSKYYVFAESHADATGR